MISKNQVLMVGPSIGRKGGIAKVLHQYSIHLEYKIFFSTLFQRTFLTFLMLPERLLSFFIFLLVRPSVKIVHIHMSSEGSFYRKYIFFQIAKLFGKKAVVHIHSGRFLQFYSNSRPYLRRKIEKVFKKVDAVCLLSSSWKKQFESTLSLRKSFVVPNMIDYPGSVPKKKIRGPKLKLIFLGGVTEKKGIFDLLDVILSEYEIVSSALEINICGVGDEQRIKKYKSLDRNNIFHFLGWVDSDNKIDLLLDSDVLVLPSYSEGLPISILEAMSYGLGIITSNVGGIPEIVDHESNGYLIEPGDKDALIKYIKLYMNNYQLINNHAGESSKRIMKYYPDAVRNELESIYQSLNVQ